MHDQRFYRQPLLIALARLGGAAARPAALAEMEVLLAGTLSDGDRAPRPKRGEEEGWRNRTSWEVKVLKDEGLMQPTSVSGNGNWALSVEGLQAAEKVSEAPFGQPYRSTMLSRIGTEIGPFKVDPDLIDRGLRAHQEIVRALAIWVQARGLEPLLPTATTPQFDLAWIEHNILNVAEIKSTTEENEERQMRLGLGQVLRYRHILSERYQSTVAWLVVEREPGSSGWTALCSSLQVILKWPTEFAGDIDEA